MARVLTDEEVRYAQELRSWRERRGMSKKALADATAYDPSRVSHIESGRQAPTEEFTRQAEAALQTGGALQACWEAIAASRFGPPNRPLERELRTAEFVGWLADHSGTSFQSLYASVESMVARLEAEPPSARYSRDHVRRLITREQIARAAMSYYSDWSDRVGTFYRAKVGTTEVPLSILTQPTWLDVAVELGSESFRFIPPTSAWHPFLDDLAVSAAVNRLASVEISKTVMVNNPLYRLLGIDLAAGSLSATVTTVDFADHAMTSELMEGELLDAITSSSDALPLRDRYLPTIRSVLDLGARACVGGPVTLLAIARGRDAPNGDYVLFTQERSAAVLNLAGRLAVVPKGFHQPTGEAAHEARLSITLQREFEEEMLGREDLEQLAERSHHRVDLLHPLHRTEPMAWLLNRPHSYRFECTGLGFNTLTGNCEFACLIVIEDDRWWDRFGHLVVMNWEAERVHRYSSLDTAGLEALIADPRWGNESLFSLLQGLRRLQETGAAHRVAVPPIELELS